MEYTKEQEMIRNIGSRESKLEEIGFLQELWNNIELDYEGNKTGESIQKRIIKLKELTQ